MGSPYFRIRQADILGLALHSRRCCACLRSGRRRLLWQIRPSELSRGRITAMKADEIADMETGRELDALIAGKVMGGFVPGDPERWTKTAETWFYVHSQDGVLIGKTYEVNPE